MDFYKARRQLIAEIERIITKLKGESIKIDSLSLEISRNYGFGKGIVMNILKQYEAAGKIEIIGNEFLVVDPFKKDPEKSEKEPEKGKKVPEKGKKVSKKGLKVREKSKKKPEKPRKEVRK